MTTVKKRKLNHNSTESILGVPEQNSTGVSPITHTQGNGAVSETRMRTIAGKPLVFLDDRRLAYNVQRDVRIKLIIKIGT